jgi:hypothetical protein
MSTKKIILGYNKPFLHGKLGEPGSHGGAGLGDILRGMLSFTEYCKGRDVEIEYCFTNHPISNWLKGTQGRTNYVFEDFTTHILKSWENCYIEFEKSLAQPGLLYIETNVIPFKAIGIPSDNYYKSEYFSESTISKVRNALAFTDDILEATNNILNSYSIEGTYTIIHIRLQDYKFLDYDLNGAIPLSRVLTKLKTIEYDKSTTIFMSTSRKLLQVLQKRLGVHIRDTDAIHLGNFDDTTEELKQRIKETVLDFILLSRASQIIQLSDYIWGSGFSDSCATIYSIPIEKYLLSTD